LKDSPRDAPIQANLNYGAPEWFNRSIHNSPEEMQGCRFSFDHQYRIKPPARRRVRKLSEIIAEAENREAISNVELG
jgi:hypothetical protein